ncbi:unnamed protein product [Paramecium pentaurelia]|uniref:Rubicon Homology domain-containing protein n=1 Tax=Paramecium pentaurelia TaxID=43138 RepID=A0A8S1SVF5_9CILI|nr:unnamed protein product [Paramecium pentaurelia]
MSWINQNQVTINKPNNLLGLFSQSRDSLHHDPSEQFTKLPPHLYTKHKGKKPSQILYDEIYKEIIETPNINRFVQPPPQYELKDQNFKCWQCQKPISNGFLTIGANCDQCFFHGRYFCNDCMSVVRMPIPWKALDSFDLRHYKVSKLAQSEIDKLYDLPILEITPTSKLLQLNKTLFEFLVLKRQIHLLYDMICDPKLVQTLLEKRMNLCLKRNCFSLKDLYEIYNGSLTKVIQGYYVILYKHIDLCKSCQKRGHICSICQHMVPIHAFDIKNVTYCDTCLKVYHRECAEQKSCPNCLQYR